MQTLCNLLPFPSHASFILNPVLVALELKDFAIVDELRLDLSPGLNVLTGETGAGKSILVDALTLLTGGRADSSLVRTGAQSALIQGIFEDARLESAARRLQRSGRSTARINGELVTVGELSEVGADLIAIHGQHASQTLLDSAAQRQLLDRLLPPKALHRLNEYRTAYRRFTELSKALAELKTALRERAQRLDMLQFQLEEIGAAKLKAGEETALRERLESLRHAERIVQGAGSTVHKLSEGDTNAVDLIATALRDLQSAGRYHKTLADLGNELSDAMASVEAISAEVSSFLSDFEMDAGQLETSERRLAQIEGLKLKYGDSVEAVLAYFERASGELGKLERAEGDMSELEAERAQLEGTLHAQADELSKVRAKAAKDLSERVTRELRPLGMANARFVVGLERRDELTQFGQDKVTFLFSANLGEPPAPLSTVASGGELSRLMLSLNVATGTASPTLIFDEVDAGLGGQTARSVGALLKRLAAHHQVLVVTHLPQVAAFADVQFYVQKVEDAGRTATRISRLDASEREAELARMLSGATTETALAHARELLQETQTAV